MLRIITQSRYEKDLKKVAAQGHDLADIFKVITTLAKQEPLDPKYVDHPLKGNYKGYRDCHIKNDLVLIYKIEDDKLILSRINSHSEVFSSRKRRKN